MDNSLTETDLTTRRGELSTYGRSINASRSLKTLLLVWAIVCAFVLILAVVVMPQGNTVSRIAIAIAIAAVLIGSRFIWSYTHRHFIEPDLAFRKWLQQLCDGEFNATIGLAPGHPHYKELNFHSKNISSALSQLSTDMENLVEKQTSRLEKQNRVLELLFHLTSDVAAEIDQSAVLNTVCTYLCNWLGDARTAAYMVTDDQLKLQATSHDGEFPTFIDVNSLVSATSIELDEQKRQHLICIPVFNGKEPVGVVQAICNQDELLTGKGSRQVFKSVSEQLSIFVARYSALETAHQASLINERNQLGAEIHDSLAQTLLASRYQLNLLRETIESNPKAEIYNDVLRIEGIIQEANTEVRELIGAYREIPQGNNWVDSLQQLIDKFSGPDEIPLFFQCDNPHIHFTTREYSAVERIVSESLFNANKYSQATMIRVYVRVENSGVRNILIEDDGIGFSTDQIDQQNNKSMGNHIGLSIMRDRAVTIGAMLTIDSEPGEGTRINLKLPPFVSSNEQTS